MAKSSVKRPAAKSVGKTGGKPAATKLPTKSASKPAAKSATKQTTKAKPAAKVVSKPGKDVVGKPASLARAPKTPTNSPEKSADKRPATKPETIKVVAPKSAVNGKTPVNGKPLAAKLEAGKPANGTAVAEAPKPSGRPMLMQGHVPSTALTKKGTFAPGKLPLPAPKPVKRKIERPEPEFVTLQPPVAQVRTSEKAVKNRAGLSQKDLDFFRDLLLQKRRELVGDMSHMEREALRENNANLSNLPVHMADQGTDAYEQEFTLGLVEKDRTLLREINDAMAKLQNGTYGICEGTGNPIGRPRLEAQPWARHSIEFARILEKRKMMFRR